MRTYFRLFEPSIGMESKEGKVPALSTNVGTPQILPYDVPLSYMPTVVVIKSCIVSTTVEAEAISD